MAYNAVPTQNTGDEWSAAEHNTYVKDNFAAGVPDIFTTKGDIAAATAANAASRLGVGADGTVLMASSAAATGLAWTVMPMAHYKTNAGQSIASADYYIINYEDLVYDTASAVSVGPSWNFTAPVTGYYLVQASALLASAAWDAGEFAALKLYYDNAAGPFLDLKYAQAAGTRLVFLNGSCVYYAVAAKDIDIRIYQNSGGAIALGSDSNATHVSISRLF